MRYMCLIHHDEAALAAAPPSLWGEYAAFNEAMAKAGMTSGEGLEPSSKATSVRVNAGKKTVIDGPYADTKEQFAGYFIVDVPDLDAALDWAARCPSAQYGTIEVRPIKAWK
ncbi:hypothetical protein ABIB57_002242 [Devosia sp. UYZn731]|uniref:YciI family protein n=1 Tax=Devosia sp. UYZn731 TaxID=3156345 RepID=UPI0033921724